MSRTKIFSAAVRTVTAIGLVLILAVSCTPKAVGDDPGLNRARDISSIDDLTVVPGVATPAPQPSVAPLPQPPSPQPTFANAQPLSMTAPTDLPPLVSNGCGPICTDLLDIAPNMVGGIFGGGTGNIDFSNIPGLKIAKIKMPNPAESVLGRTTIADDSSPVPRDRFFFDYDYFYQVPLSPNGDAVNRFLSGFEKTFLNGLISAEVRIPFGTTLDNDMLVKTGKLVHGITRWGYETNGEDLQLGNVAFGAKALLFRCRDELAVSAGLLVTVPTANDLAVTGLLSPLHATAATLQIKNEAVHVAPYLGSLWTPTDRIFLQGFLQLDFDANGQEVVLENGAASDDLGRYRDQTFLFLDAGIGYWLLREEYVNWAALFEVHYNASLQHPDTVNVSPGQVDLASEDGNINLVDLVLGTSVQVCDDTRVSLAYIFAVGAGQDEQFTREIRATFNWQF